MSILFSDIVEITKDREMTIVADSSVRLLNICNLPKIEYFSRDYLYAIKASSLSEYPYLENVNLLVYADTVLTDDFFHTHGLNAIVTRSLPSFQRVYLQIQELFDASIRLNDFNATLMQLSNRGSIQDLLDYGASFFSNPLLLADCSLVMKMYSGVTEDITDPLVRHAITEGALPSELVHSMLITHSDGVDEADSVITESNIPNYKSTSIVAGRLMSGKDFLGYLNVVECHRPLTDVEREKIPLLCKHITFLAMRNNPRLVTYHRPVEDFIYNILNQKLTDPDAIMTRSNLFQLNPALTVEVLTIAHETAILTTEQLAYYKELLTGWLPTSVIVALNNRLVLILTENEYKNPAKRERFRNFIEENPLIASSSLEFAGYQNLRKHYLQTLSCFEMRTRFGIPDKIIRYRNHMLTHMIINFEDFCDLDVMIPDYISRLELTDATKGTHLLDTLFCYLHHRFNITETANELLLHYNTLKYRVNQIVDISGIDFSNPNIVFEIAMAEQVMKIGNKR